MNTNIAICTDIRKNKTTSRNSVVGCVFKQIVKVLSFDAEPIFKSKKWPYLY